jgi:hypothetical protein
MVVMDLEDFTRGVIDKNKIETPGAGGDGEAF